MSSEAVGASAGKAKYLIITAFVMALDQFTKYVVSTRMQEGDEIDVIRNFFAISYTKNPGIAFGMLNSGNLRWLFVAISVVAVLVVLAYMMRTAATNRLLLWSLALLAAGICGNLIDRVRIGRVIDFFLVHYRDHQFPVFNVADTAISIGAALMAIELFITPQSERATEAAPAESLLSGEEEPEVRSQEPEGREIMNAE
ncbi:MAG: signal peptidase II [Blastocatellia bacterium]